jgi:diadenylate cyclase
VPDLGPLLSSNAYLIVDTLLVAIATYYILLYVRGTKTAVLIQALLILGFLYFLCQYFKLITLAFLLERVLTIGPIAVLVIFAPEIRAILERASKRSRLIEWLSPQAEVEEAEAAEQPYAEVLVDAVAELAQRRRGALIVIERNDDVVDHIVVGTRMDALPSVRLLVSIFEEKNPLHDGAALIREDRIHSAGDFLPISENTAIPPELGTRHRAAIGLTERCDAVVAVASEERGEISIAFNGRLARHLSVEQFNEQLRALLEPNENFATVVPRGVYI